MAFLGFHSCGHSHDFSPTQVYFIYASPADANLVSSLVWHTFVWRGLIFLRYVCFNILSLFSALCFYLRVCVTEMEQVFVWIKSGSEGKDEPNDETRSEPTPCWNAESALRCILGNVHKQVCSRNMTRSEWVSLWSPLHKRWYKH